MPTGNVYYAYDEAGHLIGEYDANLVPIYETVYLGDTPVAVIKQVRSGSGKNVTVTTQLSYVYARPHRHARASSCASSDHAIAVALGRARVWGDAAELRTRAGSGCSGSIKGFRGRCSMRRR